MPVEAASPTTRPRCATRERARRRPVTGAQVRRWSLQRGDRWPSSLRHRRVGFGSGWHRAAVAVIESERACLRHVPADLAGKANGRVVQVNPGAAPFDKRFNRSRGVEDRANCRLPIADLRKFAQPGEQLEKATTQRVRRVPHQEAVDRPRSRVVKPVRAGIVGEMGKGLRVVVHPHRAGAWPPGRGGGRGHAERSASTADRSRTSAAAGGESASTIIGAWSPRLGLLPRRNAAATAGLNASETAVTTRNST